MKRKEKKRKGMHLKVLILFKALLYGNTKQGKLPIYTLSVSQVIDVDFNVCKFASDRMCVCVCVSLRFQF